ncbi:MAG: RloB family protein [Actinomyces sp.]|uniref:RloB family protein n=1 Tax=Actinomyces sp. TaxID=29317 RepID=UPI0026DAB75F|nr:RloB family protein [Actinomyces sp.]MDO4242858.1 RloB family protein [Actinomyces sp.]
MAPKRRPQRPARQERRTVLLVTNGKQTERTYLDQLKRRVATSIAVTTKFINGAPLTVTKELQGPRSDTSSFDEVWIVVDHDGTDRSDFLAVCRRMSTRKTAVHGVVSVPCFEVWLNAHYGPIRNYQDQADAQRHYRDLVQAPPGGDKGIPPEFPWDKMSEAAHQCYLTHAGLPAIDTQGPCPSTTMPHLLAGLGLLTLPVPPA